MDSKNINSMFNDFNSFVNPNNFNESINHSNEDIDASDFGSLEDNMGPSLISGMDSTPRTLSLENKSNCKKINIHMSKTKIKDGNVKFSIDRIGGKIECSISFLDLAFTTLDEISGLFQDMDSIFQNKVKSPLKDTPCSLTFSYNSFDKDSNGDKCTWQAIMEEIKRLKVVSLSLKSCSFVNENPIIELCDGKIKTKLEFFTYRLRGEEKVDDLIEFLKKNRWLKKLSLKNVDFSDEVVLNEFSSFLSSLQSCKNLNEIELDNSTFSEKQGKEIFEVLGCLKKLKRISLSDIAENNAGDVISSLRWDLLFCQHQSIQEIDLSCNKFKVEVISDLIKTKTPGLRKLNFCATDFIVTDPIRETGKIPDGLKKSFEDKGISLIEDESYEDEIVKIYQDQSCINYNSFLYQQQTEEQIKGSFKNKELIEGMLSEEHLSEDNLKKAFSADYGSILLTEQNLNSLLIHLVEKKGFKKIEVPMDGACLFHSIAHLLNAELGGLVYTSDLLREEMIAYMRKNPESFKQFLEDNYENDVNSDEKYEQHLEKMTLANSWAGNMELVALAFYLERSIIVYDFDAYKRVIQSGGNILKNNKELIDLEWLRLDPQDGPSSEPLYIYRSHFHFSPLFLQLTPNENPA